MAARLDGFVQVGPAHARLHDGVAELLVDLEDLYNNASMPKFAPFVEQSDEDYLFTIDNELHLVWRACQLAWPPVAKVGGAIVNIGPGAGLEGVRTLPRPRTPQPRAPSWL